MLISYLVTHKATFIAHRFLHQRSVFSHRSHNLSTQHKLCNTGEDPIVRTYQNQNYSWCDRVYVWVAFIFLIYNFAQDSVLSFQISNYLGLFNVHIGSARRECQAAVIFTTSSLCDSRFAGIHIFDFLFNILFLFLLSDNQA